MLASVSGSASPSTTTAESSARALGNNPRRLGPRKATTVKGGPLVTHEDLQIGDPGGRKKIGAVELPPPPRGGGLSAAGKALLSAPLSRRGGSSLAIGPRRRARGRGSPHMGDGGEGFRPPAVRPCEPAEGDAVGLGAASLTLRKIRSLHDSVPTAVVSPAV